MVIRDSHLQFDKTKISIEADLRKFICNPDKPDICWSTHNTEHKWPKKADAATCYTSVFPNYSLTRPKSTFRQNCVSLFPIQTRCTYVNLGLIGNKTGQRNGWRCSWSSVIPTCSLTIKKSTLRKNCVRSFQSQTSCRYFDLIIIQNKIFPRTHLQLFLIVRISHLQFDCLTDRGVDRSSQLWRNQRHRRI